jgi:hypothetical protein
MPLFDGGIRTDKDPVDLAPNELVDQQGLHLVAGRLVVDTGYVPFSGAYDGVAQCPYQVLFNSGGTVELLITSLGVYTYNSTFAQWDSTALTATTTTTAGYTAGATQFALTSVAHVTIGAPIGIVMDNGQQLVTLVTNIVALVVTTRDAVPVGRTVSNGATVYPSVLLHGDPTVSQAQALVFPGNDWIVFTNGIDNLYYFYQGIVTLLPGLPVNTTCASLAIFHESLMLLNTTEGGTHLPHRIRASDAGDPTGWTPGVNGIAAIYDLLDTDDYILSGKLLGPWIIAYREHSVMRGSYVGALNEIVFWEYMSQEDGIQSQGAVADVGSAHITVGTNGVYEYRGGYDLPNVGQGVFENFLASNGDLFAPSKFTLFTVYVPVLREVWILYPSSALGPPPGTPAVPNKMLRYHLDRKAWSVRVFADEFVATGTYVPVTTVTWTSAVGVWSGPEWAISWESRVFVKTVPNLFLAPYARQQLLVYDYAAMADNGATIPWTLTTRQLGDGGEFSRWERATLVGTGTVGVEFSEDEGATWLALNDGVALALGVAPAVESVTTWIDVVSTRVQFRLSGTDPSFALRYIDVYEESESEW